MNWYDKHTWILDFNENECDSFFTINFVIEKLCPKSTYVPGCLGDPYITIANPDGSWNLNMHDEEMTCPIGISYTKQEMKNARMRAVELK